MTDETEKVRSTTAELRRALFRPPAADEFPEDPTTFDGIPIFDAGESPSDEGTFPQEDAPYPVHRESGSGGGGVPVWPAIMVAGVAFACLSAATFCGLAASGAAVAWTMLDTPAHSAISTLP